MMRIPRPEYPRPQMVRDEWENLNGLWTFAVDNSRSGLEREFYKQKGFADEILVPFSPESQLSGVGNVDFMQALWYHRLFKVPESWQGCRIILHFGAVDYLARVYINGQFAGGHQGGYTPFSLDITEWVKAPGEENTLVVYAEDDVRSRCQPAGKQCQEYFSHDCSYTRTTGIWQTVWMEPVRESAIERIKYTVSVADCQVMAELSLTGWRGARVLALVSYQGKEMGRADAAALSGTVALSIPLAEAHLWEPGAGRLYDVEIWIYRGDQLCDRVKSYFGLREVGVFANAFCVNGKPVFGRWVLDQGFYPDGIYTAPDDKALCADIEAGMRLGFNGARMHQKIFEPRYLYWADKLGYLVWGEFPDWGLDLSEESQMQYILPEWLETMERDRNHPSLIGWCPLNEVFIKEGKTPSRNLIRQIYKVTKAVDPSRPVIDASGGYHVETDIYDVHDYTQDPEAFAALFQKKLFNPYPKEQADFQEGAYFVSEYGGIQWNVSDDQNGWGYGKAPESEAAFVARYRALTETLLQDERMLGFCYTQLYDVEQEMNGLMTYDRKYKFAPEIFYAINTQKAAVELVPVRKERHKKMR